MNTTNQQYDMCVYLCVFVSTSRVFKVCVYI